MKEFILVTWTFFLMAFLECPQFSGAAYTDVEIQIGILKNLRGSCCSGNRKPLRFVANRFILDCDVYFWNSSCFIELRSDKHVPVKQIQIMSPNKAEEYEVNYVQSLLQVRFTYTVPQKGVLWTLTVHTSNKSASAMGRIYITMKCKHYWAKIPLANSFDNFNPGRTDVFTFNAPRIKDLNYCVEIYDSVLESWIMDSMTLTYNNNTNNVSYTFYHGELTNKLSYYGYQGSNPVSWRIVVTTGNGGTNYLVDIVLVNGKCETRLSMDNAVDNFQPNKTDVFNLQAKNCNGLEKIHIISQDWNPKWVLEKIRVTQGRTNYTFYHNEILGGQQTFFVNQDTGGNKWRISVCTTTSTDDQVYMKLHYRHGETEYIRLTTPKNDFEANQCSNFTHGTAYLGKVWMVELTKPKTLSVSKIILYNKGHKYEFLASAEPARVLKLVYYQMGMEIFKPDVTGKKERECAHACVSSKNCLHFHIDNNACKFDSNKDTTVTNYSLRNDFTVWTVALEFPVAILEARVTLVGPDDKQIIYSTSLQTQNITTTFTVLSSFYDTFQNVILEIIPTSISCSKVVVRVTKYTATQIEAIHLHRNKCSWRYVKTVYIPRMVITTPGTTAAMTTELPTSSMLPTDTKTIIYARNTIDDTTPSYSTISQTDSPTTDVEITDEEPTSTVSYLTISQTNNPTTNSPTTEVEIPDERHNRSKCKCLCPIILSKEEEVEHMKELVKELKVNKNETTSYLRSKTSAPDKRPSSKVIGSTAVIIMAVPFALILLVDLIPILTLLYQKAVSLM